MRAVSRLYRLHRPPVVRRHRRAADSADGRGTRGRTLRLPSDPAFAHVYLEAGRLAQADRRRYVGDPGFVDVPTHGLVANEYVRRRAQLIDPERAQSLLAPGSPAGIRTRGDSDTTDQHPATSQIAIVDRAGNALSVTTTINLNFGARLMVDGYVLNNAMINFSPAPAPDRPTANQMAGGKRPVSAMTPTIVFGPTASPRWWAARRAAGTSSTTSRPL